MIRQQSVGWMTLVLVSLLGTYAVGQDEGAAQLYGSGVHAYFAGDYDAAAALLSESIEKHGSDPRAYYFRGLALASQLGLEAGLADLMKGADIEVNQSDRPVYNINAALQRVQGSLRLELEKVRAATRKAAVERKRKRDQVRYEQLRRREDIVLFDPQRPAPPLPLDIPAMDLSASADPFASGVAFSGGTKVDYVAPQPVAPGAAAESEAPDADATAEAADPFATPAQKTEPAAASADAAAAEANPFGANLPKLELQGIDRPAGPTAAAASGLLDMLGRTLSGEAGDRDPFGPPAKPDGATPTEPQEPEKAEATPPAEAPAAEAPAAEAPAGEAAEEEPAEEPAEAESEAEAPADAAAPAQDDAPAQKPGDTDADPFQ